MMFCGLHQILRILFSKRLRHCWYRYNRGLIADTFRDNYEQAIEEYKYVLEDGGMANKEHYVYTSLGRAYAYNGDLDKAETALMKALTLSMKVKKHYPELYQWLGYVNLRKGELEEALMYFKKASKFGSKGLDRMIINLNYVKEQETFLEERKGCFQFFKMYRLFKTVGGKKPTDEQKQ